MLRARPFLWSTLRLRDRSVTRSCVCRLLAAYATPSPALQAWHAALVAAQPERRLLLPQGHVDGSYACDTLALLGDSLLKAAVIRRLGVVVPPADGAESLPPRVGSLTSRTSALVANSVFASLAPAFLLAPGVPLHERDLSMLPVHGAATAVEAAVALVHDRLTHGPAAVASLVEELFARVGDEATPSLASHNWKGTLLEFGGRLSSCAGGSGGFIATARVRDAAATSREWPTKAGAEAEACRDVLLAAGLAGERERGDARADAAAAAMAAAAAAAGAEVKASWLMSTPVRFEPVTVAAAALNGAPSGGASWLLRGLSKKSGSLHHRLMAAHLAMPAAVARTHTWLAALGPAEAGAKKRQIEAASNDDDGPQNPPGGALFLGLVAVAAPDGTQRWFVSPGAQPSPTKAKESASAAAVHGIGLLQLARDAAGEESESENGADEQS